MKSIAKWVIGGMIAAVGVAVVGGTLAHLFLNRRSTKLEDADARTRVAALVRGDLKTAERHMGRHDDPHHDVVMKDLADLFPKLAPMKKMELVGAHFERGFTSSVTTVALHYDITLARGSCRLLAVYQDRSDLPPVIRRFVMGGPCVEGLIQARARGLAP